MARRMVSVALWVGLGVGCGEDPGPGKTHRNCPEPPAGDGTPSTSIEFSRPAGLFSDSFSLAVSTPLPGTLRFTLDGCAPTEDSPEWEEELQIEASTEVRVALFDSGEPSPPRASRGYLRADPNWDLDSNLPLVVVETWGQRRINALDRPREHRPAYALVFEPGPDGRTRVTDPPIFAGRIGMHIRGSSTAEEYPKKQYKIETWDELDDDLDRAVLGMPAESDWVFHAPHSDKTFMRNHLVYAWSNRVGRWAPRTRFVEGIVDWDGTIGDEDYVGVYVWMEKIKVGPDRVAVTKMTPQDESPPAVTGGYVLARDWDHEERALFGATYDDAILIEDPRPDRLTQAQREWVQGHVDAFEAMLVGADFDDPVTGYEAWIDVESFIDHHLLVELARDVDGFVLSTFMHKERQGRIAMGPVWDFNGALGNANYFEAWRPEGWHHQNPEFPADNPNGYAWYSRLFEDPAFRARYAARWQELRAGPLSNAALLADVDSAEAQLEEAAIRNFDRWPILGEYVWPNDDGHEERDSYAAEVAYLRGWLIARLTWMDAELQ